MGIDIHLGARYWSVHMPTVVIVVIAAIGLYTAWKVLRLNVWP